MQDDRIHLQQAKGRVVIREVHVSPNQNRQGLESFNVMRWQDEDGTEGQDSVARLVQFARSGGQLNIEIDGQIHPVEAAPEGGFLMTRDAKPNEDPILRLPTFSSDS